MHPTLATRVLTTALLLASSPLASACSPYVEGSPDPAYAVFRPHGSAFESCEVSEETYRRVLAQWLQSRPPESARLVSLSLGRARDYPWISRHLADSARGSSEWSDHGRRIPPGRQNTLVAKLLSDTTFLQRLDAPFVGTAFMVRGVAVEKVLLGAASEAASDYSAGGRTAKKVKVPYDAQLWLRIVPRE
ncbi:MAG: hypothetical protein J0M13_03765 [Candidatus Accumulibacter sp.]|nr:hypothetical protein [Candidatus Accumulibacter necessarius]